MQTIPTAVVLIDASNVYHAVKSTRGHALKPHEYRVLLDQISKRFEVKEVGFYDASKDIDRDAVGFGKQLSFHDQLRNANPGLRVHTRPLRYVANVTPQKVEKAGKRVGIQEQCRKLLYQFLTALNMIRAAREKGIDMLLAVDAIETARQKKAEWVIFVTGDSDFVPAVHVVHKLGLHTLNLHTYRGSATELRNACTQQALLKLDTAVPHVYWYDQNTPRTQITPQT